MTHENMTAIDMVSTLRKHNIELVPDDNGHSWHKFAIYRPDMKIATTKIASIVGDASRNPMLDVDKKPVNTYSVNGVELVCSPDIKNPIDIRLDGYQFSNENRALTANGIDKLNLFGKQIILGTTVPIGRDSGVELVDKIKGAYSSGNIIRLGDSKQLQIIDVVTYGEGLMAAYDWFITDDGKINKETRKDVSTNKLLVIDIGGGTTEVVAITNQGKVTIDYSNTSTVEGCGIIDVMREIKLPLERALRSAFDSKGMGAYFTECTTSMIEDTLMNDGVWRSNSFDVSVDLSVEVKKEKEEFVRKMMREVTSVVTNMGNFDRILFVGGGALLLATELKARLPNAVYLDEFGNTKGLLKVMTHLWLKNNFTRIMDTRDK